MTTMTELFSGVNFKSTIQKYCREIGWNIAEVNEDFARLVFTMQSGGDQIVIITRYGATLEFVAPSVVRVKSEDKVPDYIARKLLLRNTEKRFGFWCLLKVDQADFILSYMHNAEIELLTTKYFAAIVRALTEECDEFDTLYQKLLR